MMQLWSHSKKNPLISNFFFNVTKLAIVGSKIGHRRIRWLGPPSYLERETFILHFHSKPCEACESLPTLRLHVGEVEHRVQLRAQLTERENKKSGLRNRFLHLSHVPKPCFSLGSSVHHHTAKIKIVSPLQFWPSVWTKLFTTGAGTQEERGTVEKRFWCLKHTFYLGDTSETVLLNTL